VTGMRIGYFTNCYPAPSHTFIRRELIALERRGHSLFRYAIRRAAGPLVDRDDIAEQVRTRYLLHESWRTGLLCCALTLMRRPKSLMRAAWVAIHFSRLAGHAYGRHLAYLYEAILLACWCRRDAIEHLHVHFGTNPATVACLVHILTGIPFSVTIHGPEEFDRPERLGLEAKVATAAFAATVSSYGRSQLLRWARLHDWKKIHIVPCGIDEDFGPPVAKSAAEPQRLLCIGRLCEQKGHLLLLEAAQRLLREGGDFKLVLVGDGPLRGEIERRVTELGLQNRVELTGTVSQDRVRLEIGRARALVLPSFAEGLPVVLMESMALGRPVIATYIAGIPELVTPQTGWLVPAGDAQALAEAMRAMLDLDEAQLATMGDAARQRVLQRHDVQRSAATLEALMAAAATRRRAADVSLLSRRFGAAGPDTEAVQEKVR
jgi:colanic acid/amylovoran biosynthesis glycosyltransferase